MTAADTSGSIEWHGPGDRHEGDLPADPFVALRVAYGMLLGEDDFRVLSGNPRGKQRLHSAWLHGPGVVWGYGVRRDGGELVVEPGLAVDGLGRELRLTTQEHPDLDKWVAERMAALPVPKAGSRGYKDGADQTDGETRQVTIRGWVVVRADLCLTDAVPALADPCDVTRRHDAYSRVAENVRLEIRDEPPPMESPFLRLWMLMGLKKLGGAAGKDVEATLARVASQPPDKREFLLRKEIERLARCDTANRKPVTVPGADSPDEYPVPEDSAGVVLAEVCLDVTCQGDSTAVDRITLHACEGRPAVPNSTLFELLSAVLARLLGSDHRGGDAGGPRLTSVIWTKDPRRKACWLQFDRPILAGSWEGAIEISSLSEQGDGWARAEISDGGIEYADETGTRLAVRLDGSPAYQRLRVVVRGTGATPLFGSDPVAPFAGRPSAPPGSLHEGHDAADVQAFTKPATTYEEAS